MTACHSLGEGGVRVPFFMSAKIKTLQKKLYTWYQKNSRDLPWRKTKDPYSIWISEVMLQQTRVETVIDYWHRFLKTFPTIKSLAKASQQDVLQIWQGLGYYRRAKHLHEAAHSIVENHKANIPQTYEDLLKLKGFGTYTAGAVASIAFGQKVPCVDGNVKRVLSRIFATHNPINEQATALSKHQDPSSINQSLMELGALICTPKNPKCLICPVSKNCTAFNEGKIESYPAKTKKNSIKNVYAVSLALQDPKNQKYFFQKRTQKGRWENLWEFPYFEFDPKKTSAKEIIQNHFPKITNLTPHPNLKHHLTHQNIHIEVYSAHTKTKASSKEQKWIELDNSDLPKSILQKKIQNLLT